MRIMVYGRGTGLNVALRVDALVEARPTLQVTGIGESGRSYSSYSTYSGSYHY